MSAVLSHYICGGLLHSNKTIQEARSFFEGWRGAASSGVWDLKFPDQASNPHTLQQKRRVLTTQPRGKTPVTLIF